MRHTIILTVAVLLSLSSHALAQTAPDSSQGMFVDVTDEPEPLQPLEKLIVYPEAARRSGLEGKVTVQALIGKDGSVEKVQVLKCTNDIFKDAAIDAMQHAKFTPGKYYGTPLELWITRTINFKLGGGSKLHEDSKFGNFKAMLGMSKAQILKTFQSIGNVDEEEETDGIYLHAVSSSGFSESLHPASLDGIIGDNGLQKITVFYHFDNDDDFNTTASVWDVNKFDGGKLTSVSADADFPNMTMSIALDSKQRTLRVVLTAK